MKISRSLGIVLLIAANIAVDQISKVIIRQSVDPREQISLIGDVFVMMNVENTGAFLGMGSDLNPTFKLIFLLLLPVLVLGYLIYYIFKTITLDRFSLVALCCIAGGGIANVYDRIVYGSVTDFLHLDFGGMLKTGIFNIADVSVTTGMIMLLVANFFHKKNVKTA
ncbi:signal peptidase II [Mangrovimonas sp. DI 80]|uniref:signal peptidase II n=1 Tax=Mangrovimonas sp. DI 80 TaxID=1779330 RepID=UPI0009785C9A|nr:signal peptidase II [Mangrovimonas sp. DI 80]OMP31472.1 signal peptidase II [Mangrovimonas sp. DI 80]